MGCVKSVFSKDDEVRTVNLNDFSLVDLGLPPSNSEIWGERTTRRGSLPSMPTEVRQASAPEAKRRRQSAPPRVGGGGGGGGPRRGSGAAAPREVVDAVHPLPFAPLLARQAPPGEAAAAAAGGGRAVDPSQSRRHPNQEQGAESEASTPPSNRRQSKEDLLPKMPQKRPLHTSNTSDRSLRSDESMERLVASKNGESPASIEFTMRGRSPAAVGILKKQLPVSS